MQEKLKELALRYEDLQAQLADPSVYGDAERLKTVNRELKDLTPVAEAYQAYRQAEADRAAAEELLSDPEMRELAQEELTAAREEMERLRQEPFIEFLPGQETDNSRMLQQLQIRPKIRFATSDSRAAIAMVRAGLGITLLNDILTADLADGVAVLPLDPPQSVHLGIALPEEEHVSPAAKRFITYALDRLPELDVL